MVQQVLVNGLVMGCYYILIAVGLSTIYGVLGISHFAHGSVSMIGGYLCYLLVSNAGVPFVLAIIISMVFSAVLGVVIERFGYRPIRTSNAPGINVFIVALGIGMLIDNLTQYFFGPDQVIIKTSLTGVVSLGSLKVSQMRLVLMAVTLVLIVLLVLYMQKTKLGKAIRATAQNRDAAVMMGINTNVIIALVFAISSAYGAVAGSFMGSLFAVYPSMGNGTVMKGFAVLILGGLGSIPGTVVGGLIIGLFEALCSFYISSDFKEIYAFAIMILVLIIKPNGLLGRKER